MILIVADSSPIRYLVVIGTIDVLPKIYDRIVLPPVVAQELMHPNAPEKVRAWASELPRWVEVISGKRNVAKHLTDFLDPGEAAAITLAQEMGADLVLLDE